VPRADRPKAGAEFSRDPADRLDRLRRTVDNERPTAHSAAVCKTLAPRLARLAACGWPQNATGALTAPALGLDGPTQHRDVYHIRAEAAGKISEPGGSAD